MSQSRRLTITLALVAVLSAACSLRSPDAPTATPPLPPPTVTVTPPLPTATPSPTVVQLALPTTAPTFGPILSGAPPDVPAATATPSGDFGPVTSGEGSPALASPTTAPLLPEGQRFTLRDEAIRFQPHPDGCDILVITGQVFDAEGAEIAGRHRVHVWGQSVDLSADAGAEPRWGASGYQVVLAAQPQEITLRLQLLDVASGAAASEVFRVRTLARCEANHLIADFVPLPRQ